MNWTGEASTHSTTERTVSPGTICEDSTARQGQNISPAPPKIVCLQRGCCKVVLVKQFRAKQHDTYAKHFFFFAKQYTYSICHADFAKTVLAKQISLNSSACAALTLAKAAFCDRYGNLCSTPVAERDNNTKTFLAQTCTNFLSLVVKYKCAPIFPFAGRNAFRFLGCVDFQFSTASETVVFVQLHETPSEVLPFGSPRVRREVFYKIPKSITTPTSAKNGEKRPKEKQTSTTKKTRKTRTQVKVQLNTKNTTQQQYNNTTTARIEGKNAQSCPAHPRWRPPFWLLRKPMITRGRDNTIQKRRRLLEIQKADSYVFWQKKKATQHKIKQQNCKKKDKKQKQSKRKTEERRK